MSRIDHSIYSQFQPADIFGSVQKGIQMRDQMDERARKQAELAKQKGIDAAYKAGVTQNPDGTLSYDNQKTTAALFGTDPREAMKFQQDQAARDAQALEQRQKKNAFEAEHVARELEGVKDQASYAAAGDRLKAAGVDMNGWDPVYSPDRVARAKYGATTYSQRLAQQNADREFGLKKEELGLKRQEAAAKKAEQNAKSGKLEGIKALDKDYAQDYNDFTANGVENARASIAKLESIRDELLSNQSSWTSGGGRASALPDALRSRDSIRWRDQAQSAANSTLKAIFGGGLSDGERKAAASEYYNDGLNNEENAKILSAKIETAKQGLANQMAKASYFKQNGTLAGFEESSALKPRGASDSWESSQGNVAKTKTLKTSDIEWAD